MKKLLNRKKSLLKSACLGLGLATAWEVESAEAHSLSIQNDSIAVYGVVDPVQPLDRVHLLFAHNATGFQIYSRALFSVSEPRPIPYFFETGWSGNSAPSFQGERYAIIGRYMGPDPGISLSFASGAGILGEKTWSDLFEAPDDGRPDYTEAQVLEALNAAYYDEESGRLFSIPVFFKDYYNVIGATYGQDSVLINFSTGAYGGTVTAVPEPTTWIGFGFGLLALLLMGRRQRGP